MITTPNTTVGEYLEPGYSPSPKFIADGLYGQVLDSMVFACVDIALTHQGKLLLGKRTRDPQPDWWILGGRMKAGELFAGAATRLVAVEAGLQLLPERFSYLTMFAAAWKKRAHPPYDGGTHTVSAVMTTELSEQEVASITLNDEYSEMVWADPAAVAADESFHPGLRQAALALTQLRP